MQTEKVHLMDAALFASSVEMAGAREVSGRWKGKLLMSVDLSLCRQAMDSAGYVVGTEMFSFSFKAFKKSILGIPKNPLVEKRYPLASHAVLTNPTATGIKIDHPEPYEAEDADGEGYFPPDGDFAQQELERFLAGVPWQRFDFLADGDPDDRDWTGRRCWRMVPELIEEEML